MCEQLFSVAIGMVLGDGTLYKESKEGHIKFEQGYKQKEFLYPLFDLFKNSVFMERPGIRLHREGPLINTPKSYWFNTFSHPTFTEIYDIFYLKNSQEKRKPRSPGLITNFVDRRALAFWVMCDGSLQKDKRSMILHTQSFTEQENTIISKELNQKFQIHSRVIKHKSKYTVIFIPSQDSYRLKRLLEVDFCHSFKYNLPKCVG